MEGFIKALECVRQLYWLCAFDLVAVRMLFEHRWSSSLSVLYFRISNGDGERHVQGLRQCKELPMVTHVSLARRGNILENHLCPECISFVLRSSDRGT